MNHYTCHKQVIAKPMTRGEYNTYRGWELPSDEDGSDEGYLVEYIDSTSTPNHPDHSGYISWSPKQVFEEGYSITPSTYLERLHEEYVDLIEKLTKLTTFLESDAFLDIEPEQQDLLAKQATTMMDYADILAERLGPLAVEH